MTAPKVPKVPGIVLFGGLGLVLFSILFSLAVWFGRWPRLPPGAFHDTDLWAGLIGGVAFLLVLVLRQNSRISSSD